MISPNFYRAANLIKKYLEGKVLHYPIKDRIYAVQFYEHTLQKGESLYTLAEGIFGQDTVMWTVIGEINPARRMADWQPGDTINMPLIVTQEQTTDYRAAPVYYEQPSTWPQRKKTHDIIPSPTCGIPTVIATNVSTSLIRFSWSNVQFAAYYIYQIKTEAQDWADVPEVQILTDNLEYVPGGSGVTYNFRIKTVCSFGGESAYTTPTNITSLVPGVCTVPTGLIAYFVTSETAALQWSGASDGLYKITYVEGSNTYTVNVTGLSYVLQGLNANTEYTVTVQKICTDTLSTPSNEITFTTNNSCGLPMDVHVAEYGNDFIKIAWDAGVNALAYEVIAYTDIAGLPKVLQVQNISTSTATITELRQGSAVVATNISAGKYFNGYNTGFPIVAEFGEPVNGTVKMIVDGLESIFSLTAESSFSSGVLNPDDVVELIFDIQVIP